MKKILFASLFLFVLILLIFNIIAQTTDELCPTQEESKIALRYSLKDFFSNIDSSKTGVTEIKDLLGFYFETSDWTEANCTKIGTHANLSIKETFKKIKERYDIRCNTNSDCGADFIKRYYCSNKDIYANYIKFVCWNPAAANSYCNITSTMTFIKQCEENKVCIDGKSECQETALNCQDGTAYSTCSTKKPWYCNIDGSLTENCSLCGCNATRLCMTNGSCGPIPPKICDDGTSSGACSVNKPFYCNAGNLTERCSWCGCPDGGRCLVNGSCKSPIRLCSDGTLYNTCSVNKPSFCREGNLTDDCALCGCSTGGECMVNGSCKLPPPESCKDGTLNNQCSLKKPKYCLDGKLINKCSVCGCEKGVCLDNGNCARDAEIKVITSSEEYNAGEQVILTKSGERAQISEYKIQTRANDTITGVVINEINEKPKRIETIDGRQRYIIELKSKTPVELRRELEAEIQEKEERLEKADIDSKKEELELKVKSQAGIIRAEHESAKIKIEDELYKRRKNNAIEENEEIVIKNEFYNVFNGFTIELDDEEVKLLEGLNEIKSIYPDNLVEADLTESVPLIHADEVWQLNDSLGRKITGKNVKIAIIDTGIDYTHKDLGGCFGEYIFCGDNICNGNETIENCLVDCKICGNNICESPFETLDSCPFDCKKCGDDICTSVSENNENCPEDCQFVSIKTCEELQNMKEDLNREYQLENDIDCSQTVNWNNDQGFIPIDGTTFHSMFAGTLNGRGHKIMNLYINSPTKSGVGLFGRIANISIITDVHLENIFIKGGSDTGGLIGLCYGSVLNSSVLGDINGNARVGGLIGETFDGCSVSKSYTSGNVSSSEKNYYTGGLVGSNNYGATISSSSSESKVNGHSNVGGLVGLNEGSIKSSYASGNVNGSETVGGLVGNNIAGSILNSYSVGNVSASSRVGGLAGASNVPITHSYSAGKVMGIINTGGLVGAGDKFQVFNSYWDNETSGQATSVGGRGRTTKLMKQKETFASAAWDFESVWNIIENETYPYLRWQKVQEINLLSENYTCGNNFCESPDENPWNCLADCPADFGKTVKLVASADATLWESYKNEFNFADYFFVGKDKDYSGIRRALLKFNIEDLRQKKINIAQIHLRAKCNSQNSNPPAVLVYQVLKNWNEKDIDFQTFDLTGDINKTIEASDFRRKDENYYTFDVTSLVNKWANEENNYGVLLTSYQENESDCGNMFYSKDYRYFHFDPGINPKLIVNYME